MAITFSDGFDITNNEPIDARFTVPTETERLSFSTVNVYEGLIVYQKDTDKLYMLTNPASLSLTSSWTEIGIGGEVPQLPIYYNNTLSTNTPTLLNFTGSGVVLTKNANAVTLSFSGGGGGGTITSISAGSGILVNGGLGPVTSGGVTITATGGGGPSSVTSVSPGAGLTNNGTIIGDVEISLPNVGPNATSYDVQSISTDPYGRVSSVTRLDRSTVEIVFNGVADMVTNPDFWVLQDPLNRFLSAEAISDGWYRFNFVKGSLAAANDENRTFVYYSYGVTPGYTSANPGPVYSYWEFDNDPPSNYIDVRVYNSNKEPAHGILYGASLKVVIPIK
jgi:hypothetical protein